MSIIKSYLNKDSKVDLKDIYKQCQDALLRAVAYLVETSISGGGWSDFPTNRSGESTSWVSAYVLWQVGHLLPSSLTKTGLRALLSQQQECGAWGFSQSTPPDCDSTLHALQAIFRLGAKKINVLEPIKFVLSHQSKEGGFSTYKDSTLLARYRGIGNDINYNGWIQSHVCVSAVALETLIHFPNFVPKHVINSLTDFLLRTQNSESYWESYWWRSKYFATTRIIQQFHSANNAQVREAAFRALDSVIKSANVEGYWDNGYDLRMPCPLSTAYCIKALLSIGVELRIAFRGVSWLLKQQNSDGSWKGLPILQIPPPHIKSPADVAIWRIGKRGVGSCCLDERRIYTTATAASAIHKFILEIKSGY